MTLKAIKRLISSSGVGQVAIRREYASNRSNAFSSWLSSRAATASKGSLAAPLGVGTGLASPSSRVFQIRCTRAFSSSLAAEESFEDIQIERQVEMKPAPTRVFVHNDKLVPFPYEKTEDFLLEGKRGAYTTARSVDQRAVFEFEAHVERLVETTRLMMESDEAGGGECLSKHGDALCFTKLRPKVLGSVKVGMEAFREQQSAKAKLENEGGKDEEMKLTLLLTWDAENMDIYTLVTPLGERPAQPVKVQIGGKPRQNALAKDSEWTRQRRELEQAKPRDCNEVILVDDEGRLFEGLQTNFYVLKDSKLQTAGKGILEGTVRKMLLEECVKEGFPVDLSAPNIMEMDQWQGVFISSTSRLLLPVSEVIYSGREGEQKTRSFTPLDPLVTKLEELVLSRYREESTTIV